MSPGQDAFVALLGTAVLVVMAGLGVASAGDKPTGMATACEAAVAAGLALVAMRG